MKIMRGLLIICILIILTAACQPVPQATTEVPTPSLDLQKTETVIANQTLAAQNKINAQLTQEANITATAQMKKTEQVLIAASTRTARADAINTAAAATVQLATSQAQTMLDTIQKVGFEGGTKASSGTYHHLEDIESSLAKINYIDAPYYSGFSPENFAIRADIAWESASDKANWDRSACGFIFGAQESSYDLIVLTLQGYVRFFRPQPGSNTISSFADQKYSGEIQRPKGSAEVMLIVFDKRAHFYVNGEEVLNEYEGSMKVGSLFYAMVSGTNMDFGTTCKWSDVDLWIYE